jgi:hypothetical protein
MNKSVIIIVLLLVSNFCDGQGFAINDQNITLPDGFQLHAIMESNVQFLHDEWLPGTLLYPNGSTRDYEKIKFDLHMNNLHIQVDAGQLVVYANLLAGFVVKESKNLGHMFLVLDYQGEPAFYELLSNGAFQLLSYRWLVQEKADHSSPSTDEIRFEKKEKIIEVKEQLFVRSNGRMKFLKPNRNTVIKLTGADKEGVNEFVERSNLNLQLRSNMAALFNFINSR